MLKDVDLKHENSFPICKLIDKISNTRFYQDITYMISTLFLKSFYRNLQYTNLFTKLPLKESTVRKLW